MTDIRPPALPKVVYVSDDGVLHQIGSDVCKPAIVRRSVFRATRVLGVRVWCDLCWPGERCRYCEHPAGPGRECAQHLAWSTATDKALARADA